jgi:Protein of unknown function (DUF1549)/Protein of unknown function (DUF1553)
MVLKKQSCDIVLGATTGTLSGAYGGNLTMIHKLRQKHPQRRSWADRWVPFLSLATFTALIFWSAGGGAPVFAQQAKGKQKDTAPKANYEQKAKAPPAFTRPIPGLGAKVDVAGVAKIIDEEIALRLKQDNIKTSPRCDDAEFLRRVYLDVTGVIPPVDKVKAFLESIDPNKREKLIDELLAEGGYGKQLAETWANLLVPVDSGNRLLQADNLRKWLEQAFNSNKPWNKMVEEIVTASGNIEENGAATVFVANPTLDKMTNQVTTLFLGVQLQCAQCHNHPFTSWKQNEYWGMAAFFKGVKSSATPQKAAKNGDPIIISETPGFAKGGKKGNVDGFKAVPAKFLGAEQASIPAGSAARPVLAKWLTSENNPYFAKAMVNRMWAHFFGRGFVNPIADMHDGNPATHPELLAALAEQFKRHDFDLKFLAKAIMLSETYQRTSKPANGNEDDTELFSRMYMKALTPEQLFDSIARVVGPPKGGPGGGGFGGGKKGGPRTPRDAFINFFRVDEGADPLEYQSGIPQALRLMNSPLLNQTGKTLEEAMKLKTPAEVIDYLYLATVSRHATVEETQKRIAYVNKQGSARAGYADILWALLNSSEFTLNH